MEPAVVGLGSLVPSGALSSQVLLGFLAVLLLVVFGGMLRQRYIRLVGRPNAQRATTVDCPRCGVQNRCDMDQCQYCRAGLTD